MISAGAIAGAAGVGSALGGIASAGISAAAAKEMQKRQIEWERERATNAHQWEVQDLKAAGLNPILSAGGQGAATGGISAPQIDTSGIQKAGDFISSALQAKYTQAETNTQQETAENLKKDTELKETQKAETEANTILKMAETGLISEKTATEKINQAYIKAQQANIDAETKATLSKLGFEIQQMQAQAGALRAEQKYKEAAAIQQELQNKYYALNLIMDKLEQASRIGGNTAAAVRNIANALTSVTELIPVKRVTGFVMNSLKK